MKSYEYFSLVGDYHLTCPTIFLADLCAQENIPVYFYHFTLRASVSPWHQWMGVLHGKNIFLYPKDYFISI
jgi:hypothetical protein